MPPPVIPDSLDLAAFKEYLPTARDTGEGYMARVLVGAFELAKDITGRQLDPLSPTPVTITRLARGRKMVRVPDARTVTAVLVDGVEQAEVELHHQPREDSPAPVLEVFRRGRRVQVTGLFGFTSLPAELADAVYTHAARNFHERKALYADILASAEYGTQTYLRQLPARVRDVYTAYQVPSDRWGLE